MIARLIMKIRNVTICGDQFTDRTSPDSIFTASYIAQFGDTLEQVAQGLATAFSAENPGNASSYAVTTDGEIIGSTRSDADGNWETEIELAKAGIHTLQAEVQNGF